MSRGRPIVRRSRRGKGRVVVLHGAVPPEAPPDELDVLAEVEAVAGALERIGLAPEPLALTLDLESARRRLVAAEPFLVFNLVESVGASGQLAHLGPSLLEDLDLAYTGAPLTALLLSANKLTAKRLLELAGLPAPPAWQGLDGRPQARSDAWIVKSVWEHASIGLDDAAVVEDASTVEEVLAERQSRWGGSWFAEVFVEGRELNLTLLGRDGGIPEVLPAAEIRFDGYPAGKPRIVGYPAKWLPASFEYRHSRRCFDFSATDGALLAAAAEAARRCWSLFGLRGYARVDLRVDSDGRPWIIDVNANPCLAPDSGFVATAAWAGLGYDELIGRIVEAAVERGRAERPEVQRARQQKRRP